MASAASLCEGHTVAACTFFKVPHLIEDFRIFPSISGCQLSGHVLASSSPRQQLGSSHHVEWRDLSTIHPTNQRSDVVNVKIENVAAVRHKALANTPPPIARCLKRRPRIGWENDLN